MTTMNLLDFVNLRADAERRDLTTNAMAMGEDGTVFDFFGGQDDLTNKVLRHVSSAFAEDPVRVLRVARFLARFGAEWTVADETMILMSEMTEKGMLDNLTAERVWSETSKALTEQTPRLFFDMLDAVGALEVLFPELHKMKTVEENTRWHPEGNTYEHTMLVITAARKLTDDLNVMFAALTHDFGKTKTDPALYPKHHGHENVGVKVVGAFADRLKVPANMKRDAMVVSRYHMHMHKLDQLRAKTVVKMFDGLGAFNNPNVVNVLLLVGKADARGKMGFEKTNVIHLDTLTDMFGAVQSVKFMDLVAEKGRQDNVPKGEGAANLMREGRAAAVATVRRATQTIGM